MNQSPIVNTGTVAPLKNVQSFLQLAQTLIARNPNLPGLGVYFGYSGLGKTVAANYTRNSLRAHLVEVQDWWSKKTFVENLLKALHVQAPRGTMAEMMDQAIRILADDPGAPLIIDEADKLVDKNMIELVRGLHETAQTPIILVGEEMLPQKLQSSERTHNRVLQWVMAEPCDKSDAGQLAKLYCPNVTLNDELLDEIIRQTKGTARRVVTTLDEVANQARNKGHTAIGLDGFSGPYSTGQAPRRGARS